jgi:hypothetical protein
MLQNFRGKFSSIFLINRSILSRNSSVSIQDGLPSNLHLADSKILVPPPKPLLPPIDYLFPTLTVARSIPITKFNGDDKTTVVQHANLNPKIFGIALRKDIVHEVIRYQRNKKRQPKRTKRMSEISGSNKKPRPQKVFLAKEIS